MASSRVEGRIVRGGRGTRRPADRIPGSHLPLVNAFLVSTGIVAIAEIGDKTQLLSLVLAARLRRPWSIVAGILVATFLNHALAGAVGTWIVSVIGPQAMRWVLGLSFIAMAGWALVPDRLDDTPQSSSHLGAFTTTALAFFIAEMGDKTQVATVALAARYDALAAVVAGTTIGMMVANVPVVLLGERVTRRVPLRLVRVIAAALFAALGVAALVGA
jgi:putative Ca2+/H+ antiporter (TMEM165/GDT1 family)